MVFYTPVLVLSFEVSFLANFLSATPHHGRSCGSGTVLYPVTLQRTSRLSGSCRQCENSK
jgi:hypothetical protein